MTIATCETKIKASSDLAKALRSNVTPPQTLRNLQAYWLKGAAKKKPYGELQ